MSNNMTLTKTLLWGFLFFIIFTAAGYSQGSGKKTALKNYELAKKKFEANPNEENTIWLGRRTAYLGKYKQAIEIYTNGLEKFPGSYRLYRHRGHRYITTRKFKKAIADLKKAAQLVHGQPLEIEADGIPNPANIPVSNTQFNIWYHLGLAYYLSGDFEQAVSAYRECLQWCKNDDSRVATVDWLYMTYRRMNNTKAAQALLIQIKEDMNLLENHSYHNRLLMYKGLKTPASLLNPKGDSQSDPGLTFATQGYGVGNWYYYNGQKEKAGEIFAKVLKSKSRAAFGYIAAEVDLENMKPASEFPAAGESPLKVMTDPRVELMSLIFHLAGNPEYNRGRVPSYNKDIQNYFAGFKEHAVVKKARRLRQTRGVSYDAVMSMAVHVTDAYSLQEKVLFHPRPENLGKRWKIIEAREFLYDARKFVEESNFKGFIENQQKLYNATVLRLRKLLQEKGRIDWFDKFFGRRPGARFIVVPGLLNGGHSFGVRIKLPDGSEELYCILGTWLIDKNGRPTFDESVLSMVIHEFCHSYVNPMVDKYESLLKEAGKKIFPYVAEAMRRQAYPDWKIMMYESLVRAGVVRYVHAVNGPGAAKKQTREEVKREFLWTENLANLLGEYENQRSKYPDLDAFFPRIHAFFNEYAASIEKTPKIVSMIPANGATDVDPALQSITIAFDRPMNENTWSVVGGGEHFPRIDGKPSFHSKGMILTIPVTLKPGWTYEFRLNSGIHQGFMSKTGVPLMPVHVQFKTRAEQ